MADHICPGAELAARRRAEAAAAALIAQGREIVAQALPRAQEREIPMKRYSMPRPVCSEAPRAPCAPPEQELLLERLLETLMGQNQILVDILGGISALTAALLSAQCRR